MISMYKCNLKIEWSQLTLHLHNHWNHAFNSVRRIMQFKNHFFVNHSIQIISGQINLNCHTPDNKTKY